MGTGGKEKLPRARKYAMSWGNGGTDDTEKASDLPRPIPVLSDDEMI